jgi:hypothetical protein
MFSFFLFFFIFFSKLNVLQLLFKKLLKAQTLKLKTICWLIPERKQTVEILIYLFIKHEQKKRKIFLTEISIYLKKSNLKTFLSREHLLFSFQKMKKVFCIYFLQKWKANAKKLFIRMRKLKDQGKID